MISDVLHDAVCDLDRYLNEKTYNDCCSKELRERVISCRNEMNAIRVTFDKSPSSIKEQGTDYHATTFRVR